MITQSKDINERFGKARFNGERIRRVLETFNGFIEKFYSSNEDTFKNLRLGFVKGMYEEIISRASIFFYLQVEAYIGEIFGLDCATYWSLAIFRNCYMDLKEMDWVVKDYKTGRADFNQFYYGRPTTFGRPEWKVGFYNCALSNWLYGGQPEWKALFGVVLAENTELATMMIMDDIASGPCTGLFGGNRPLSALIP